MITMDGTLLMQVVNMLVLMFLLNKVLYKPVRQILRQRAEMMQGMQADIAKCEEDAELRQQEVDAKMTEASGQAKAALEVARADAQSVGDARLAAIKAEADADKEKRLAEIKTEMTAARSELQANLDTFAADMAGKILGRGL